MVPVSKIMSSPAVKVRVAFAAAPESVTTALLFISRSSLAAAEFPAVKLVDALTLTLALIVIGLAAVIVAPPVMVRALPSPSRSARVKAPVLATEKSPPITASRFETTDTNDSA